MPDIKWTNRTSILNAMEAFPEIFNEEFYSFLNLVGELLVSSIVSFTPVGTGASPTGHLSNSITHGEPKRTNVGWKMAVGSPAEYGEVVEHGRRPGGRMPPIHAITAWVWGKRHLFPEVQTEKDAKKLAFPIARSIAKKGYSTAADGQGQGWGMFEKGLKADEGRINMALDELRSRINFRCNDRMG